MPGGVPPSPIGGCARRGHGSIIPHGRPTPCARAPSPCSRPMSGARATSRRNRASTAERLDSPGKRDLPLDESPADAASCPPQEAWDERLAQVRLRLRRRRGAVRARGPRLSRFGGSAGQIRQRRSPAQVEVRSDPIQGYLTKPKGAGPFPAVVLLHSCLGLPAGRRSMADTFAGWGYVALFVDDFTTRGVRETCAVDFNEALPDAYGALAFLSRLPYVDPARIAAIGFSQGRRHRAQDRFVPPPRRLGKRERSGVQSRGGVLSAVRQRSELEIANPDPHSGRRDGRRDARGGLRAAGGETARRRGQARRLSARAPRIRQSRVRRWRAASWDVARVRSRGCSTVEGGTARFSGGPGCPMIGAGPFVLDVGKPGASDRQLRRTFLFIGDLAVLRSPRDHF